ncbi:hypothetical protein KCP75_06480 [Salmonella enterica subsp. enterica]|nr:hypothetical protein KCP75_06480 [Salmonella enterica subsp. enterica]
MVNRTDYDKERRRRTDDKESDTVTSPTRRADELSAREEAWHESASFSTGRVCAFWPG